MSKKRNKRNKSKKTKKKRPQVRKSPQKTSTKNNLLNLFATPWKIVVSIGVLCSIFAFIFLLIPRLDIELGPSLNPQNPFKNVVYIANNGYFPIVNIYRKMNITKGKGKGVSFNNVSAGNFIAKKLSPNDKISLNTSEIFALPNNLFSEINLSVEITYKLWLIPINLNKRCNFKPQINFKNEWVWVYSTP